VGPDIPIIYRFSQWKANAYDAQLVETPAELEQVLAPLVAAGVDVLHPSTRRVYIPAFPGSDLSLAGWTKKITGVPVIGVGSVGLATEFQPGKRDGEPIEPAPVDRLLAQFTAEEFDIVAIGRALLADPGWVNRLRDDTLGGFTGYHAETALASLY
jgi:2,4-dienoyl-CoA reductase-like NADH-dependent reductase (Old Yellow Enzyme family)